MVQETVGSGYAVTGDAGLMDAAEDDFCGGRSDDVRRAEDIQGGLADDDVAAMVLIRGGAWFTRILPLIDFSVIDRRSKPVALFGFSELTPLVNIVGAYEQGIGVYDMGPAFLTYGLRRFAASRATDGAFEGMTPEDWASHRLHDEFLAFFRDVVSMIEGRGSERPVSARLIAGELPERCEATFVGGNLTVLSTMVGSQYSDGIAPVRRWLMIEDFNDRPERFDRFLAHFTLAGMWDNCDGILLGDFHEGDRDLTPAIVSLLSYHIPQHRSVPILSTRQVGHVWPMSPLPLHLPLTIEHTTRDEYAIHWPPSALRTANID